MTFPQHYQTELQQERYGLKIASLLSDAVEGLPADITERLRFARSQALSRRKAVGFEAAKATFTTGSTLVLGAGDEGLSWWSRIGAALPLLALVLGLVAIQVAADNRTAREIARLDADLLMDDLPPAAYADPGFHQFLKVSRINER